MLWAMFIRRIQNPDRPIASHSLRRLHRRAPGVVDMTELRVVAGKQQRLSAAEVEPSELPRRKGRRRH